MKRLIILLSLLFSSFAYADTINLDWYVGNTLYDQTNCEIGGGVTLPNEPTKFGYDFIGWSEIFNRGTFANWNAVPTATGGYLGDSNNSNIPQENDYIIVNDASDVPEYGENIEIYVKAANPYGWSQCKTYIDNIDYGCNGYLLNEKLFVYSDNSAPYARNRTYWRSDIKDIIYKGTIFTTGNVFLNRVCQNDPDGTYYAKFISGYPYSGKWLLRYHGDWADYGRGGWIPEKQLD